jgi:hypothetical protein
VNRKTALIVGAAVLVLVAVTALVTYLVTSSTQAGPSPSSSTPATSTSSRPSSSTPTAPPTPNPADVNGTDPSSAALYVVRTMYQVDTTTDHGWSDALRRASVLLTSDYAAAVSAAPTPAPDAQWQEWAGHKAFTTATITPSPEDKPADTTSLAYRAYQVTITPTGRDGWHGEEQHLVALVTLKHEAGGWVVAQVDPR